MDKQREFKLAGRGTYLKINLDTILENLKIVKNFCAGHTDVIAVVKSNAYGHGSVPVARCLEAHGYSHFAVATAQEGKDLRKGGIKGYIQVLGTSCFEEIPSVYENRLTPTVSHVDFLSAWTQYASDHGSSNEQDHESHSPRVVIKIDTGMSRHGCWPDDLPKLVQVCNNNGIVIHSMMTQFCRSWNDEEFTKRQYDIFLSTVEPYRKMGIKFHVANSGAVLKRVGTDLDFVRVGTAMYGQAEGTAESNVRLVCDSGIKPSLEWFAKACVVKDLKPSASLGYDESYRSLAPERIAVLPFGYADGYNRMNIKKTALTTLDGIICPVVSRVAMDTTFIRLPEAAKETRVFCVMSADYNDVNSCCAIAGNMNSLQHEVCTKLSSRLPRLYEISGEITKG